MEVTRSGGNSIGDNKQVTNAVLAPKLVFRDHAVLINKQLGHRITQTTETKFLLL